MLDIVKNYIQDESAISVSVEQMLFIVFGIAGAAAVGYMIYSAIKTGKTAMKDGFSS